jgi:uracil-DNA glycosylase family 4
VCVDSRGAESPRVLVVCESPDKTADSQGRILVGRPGSHIEHLMREVGLDPAWFRYTSLVKCHPRQGRRTRKPNSDEVATCTDAHMLMEICETEPEYILALGAGPAKFFTGYTQLYRARGDTIEWTHPWTQATYDVRTTFHPNALLYHGGEKFEPHAMADLDQLRHLLTGEGRVPYHRYKMVMDAQRAVNTFRALAQDFRNGVAKYHAVDLETVGLDPRIPLGGLEGGCEGSQVLTIQVCAEVGSGYGFPVAHPESPHFKEPGAQAAILRAFEDYLREAVKYGRRVTGHNLKFDARYAAACVNAPWKVDPDAFIGAVGLDTYLASWALHGDSAYAGVVADHRLETLCGKFCAFYSHKDEMKGYKASRFDLAPLDGLLRYGVADVDGNLRLALKIDEQYHHVPDLPDYREETDLVYLDLIRSTLDMELNGVAIDVEALQRFSVMYREELATFTTDLDTMGYGNELNPGSPEQMGRFLFDTLGLKDWIPLPEQYFTDSSMDFIEDLISRHELVTEMPRQDKREKWGRVVAPYMDMLRSAVDEEAWAKGVKWSSNKLTLTNLAAYIRELKAENPTSKMTDYLDHVLDIITKLRAYRKSKTYLTRYVDPIVDMGRADPLYPGVVLVYPNYNIGGTGTGRYSSSDPSFHQFPKLSMVKDGFISRWGSIGGLILESDEKQVEVAIMAALSQDPTLLSAIRNGEDVYWAVAASTLDTTVEELMQRDGASAYRKTYKGVTLGLAYGAGAQKLSDQFGVSVEEAKQTINDFYAKMPGMKAYRDRQAATVRAKGYVTSSFGFRRLLPWGLLDNPRDKGKRAKAERQALNTPIQGSASQLVSRANDGIYWHKQALIDGGIAALKSVEWGFVHDSHSGDVFPGELWTMYCLYHHHLAIRPPQLYPWLNLPMRIDTEIGVSWYRKVVMEMTGGPCEVKVHGKPGWVQGALRAMKLWPERPDLLSAQTLEVEGEPHMEVILRLPGDPDMPEILIATDPTA